MRMPWLCLFVFLTGIAGAPAFLGALKTGKNLLVWMNSLLRTP